MTDTLEAVDRAIENARAQIYGAKGYTGDPDAHQYMGNALEHTRAALAAEIDATLSRAPASKEDSDEGR